MSVHGKWLGLQPYDTALGLQVREHEEVSTGEAGRVLGLEHAPTITLGCRGRAEDDLLAPLATLKNLGWAVETSDRGGQATLHEPGQLVIYPILRWSEFGWGPREYVAQLLETTARTLADLGLEARVDVERAGVYTPRGKIGFCGLRLQNGVSRHGLSLNVHNPLGSFQLIRPCGFAQESITRLIDEKPGLQITCEEVFRHWMDRFRERVMRRGIPCSKGRFAAI